MRREEVLRLLAEQPSTQACPERAFAANDLARRATFRRTPTRKTRSRVAAVHTHVGGGLVNHHRIARLPAQHKVCGE